MNLSNSYINYKLTLCLVLILWVLSIFTPGHANNALDKRHELPRLRGAMTGINITEKDILEFGNDWNANHIRWQLLWEPIGDVEDLDSYYRWLDKALIKLDEVLISANKAGIKILIDLHTLPGGRNDKEVLKIFTQKKYQLAFIDIWKKIARRYRNNPTVWGYDLANEPVEPDFWSLLMNWTQLAEETSREIRRIDESHAIIYEPSPWASPGAFKNLKPLNISGIVYSFHMYVPHAFTHQGIGDHGPLGVSYPGYIKGKYWNKSRLKQALEPVVEFQKKYKVPIYVGEFSALRWSPGKSAYNYLKDCIELFEQYEWDWSYHAFREWDGWSVEHGNDMDYKAPLDTDSKREVYLKSWYKKNIKHP